MGYTDFLVDRAQHMRPLEYDLSDNFNELVRYLHDVGALNNIPVGVTTESESVSVTDAYPAPPRAINVYGKSTQDGIPTPENPVPILSVDELTVHASADGGEIDYTNWPVTNLLPDSTELRSLQDGPKDKLHLSYLRPSSQNEGWAWYSRELVHTIGYDTIANACRWSIDTNPKVFLSSNFVSDMAAASYPTGKLVMCDKLAAESARAYSQISAMADDSICKRGNLNKLFVKTSVEYGSVDNFLAALGDTVIYYPLATPTTESLDPIELPLLPAPNATIWATANITPTLTLEYIRDLSAAINDMQEAIADI